MTDTLLATKFFVPPLRANLVHRQRLLDRLNECIQKGERLILISTPAGYGKTTLLGEWVQKSNTSIAWLSLDEGDNDPVKFMTSLVFALREIIPGIGDASLVNASSSQTQISSAQINSLVNDLLKLPDKTFIILDDYHYVNRQTIHDAVSTLVEHSPPNIHYIISSRADPPLPIARLRGRGQIAELRQNELRFTKHESAEFLSKNQVFDLTEDDITALANRTEGWAAGLQMAASSLVEQSDVSGFIQAFTGSNRFILDFLIEEVLANQTDEIQDFLLHTSILDQLCGPLCDQLISGFIELPTSSQDTLEELEHKNLFIIPLDDQRKWYRYHRLFSDLLRQRLMQLYPDRKVLLHQRACDWYEIHGFPEEAIEHAFGADDKQRAAELIQEAAETILMQSQVTTLLSWLRKLTPDELQTRPVLSVYYAWVLLWSGAPLEAIDSHLKLAVSRQSHSAYGLPLQAFLEIYNGNVENAIQLSRQALDQLPEEDLLLRSLANFILASSHLARGETAEGFEILEKTARTSQQVGNVMIATLILCELGDENQKLGQLQQAQRLYSQALEISSTKQGGMLPVAGKALIGLGDLEREWNHLETAAQLTIKGISLAEDWSVLGAFEGYINLVMIKDAQGEKHAADQIFSQLHELAYQFDASEVDDYVVEMLAARRNIAHGDLDSVEEWINNRSLDKPKTPTRSDEVGELLQARLRKYEKSIQARYLIAKGQHDQALILLDQVLIEAGNLRRAFLIIEAEVLRAIAFHARGNQPAALSALRKALQLAEPEGFMRVFLDHGNTLVGLLESTLTEVRDPRLQVYIQRLLTSFSQPQTASLSTLPTVIKEPAEPLSIRELEVLHYLQSSLSSTEIADELSISVNTLRSHLKNIYSKLDAHSRYEAIAHAKQFGLL
ncbi:MAG: LuxR C-terminal-related transcriptional regulator [Anaerolineales bacterium]